MFFSIAEQSVMCEFPPFVTIITHFHLFGSLPVSRTVLVSENSSLITPHHPQMEEYCI